LSIGEQQLLNNHTLKRTNPAQIEKLGWHLKNLNFQFGRTREQLFEKGTKLLQNYVAQKGILLRRKKAPSVCGTALFAKHGMALLCGKEIR
jgi:ribosomal protein S27AE